MTDPISLLRLRTLLERPVLPVKVTEAMQQKDPRDLVFWGWGDELVFAPRYRAHEVGALFIALEEAATWGEFRQRISASDWTDVLDRFADQVEYRTVAQFIEANFSEGAEPQDEDALIAEWRDLSIGERYPEDGDAFDLDDSPLGNPFWDGTWPEWLQQSMIDWMPEEIVERFGEIILTNTGDYPRLLAVQEQAVVAALEVFGFRCERNNELMSQASGYPPGMGNVRRDL